MDEIRRPGSNGPVLMTYIPGHQPGACISNWGIVSCFGTKMVCIDNQIIGCQTSKLNFHVQMDKVKGEKIVIYLLPRSIFVEEYLLPWSVLPLLVYST